MSLINYQGDSKIIKRICQLLKVTDVQDGEGHSLVGSDGIAVVTGGGGGSSTLAGLSDVDTSGVSSGDVLAYNGTSQKWEDKGLASVATSGSYNDLSNTPTIPAAQVNSDWNASSGVAQILNKPTIPDELADLTDDSTHRLVTDTEKTAWSAKVDDNPTFSEASTRANIDSGDSFAIILGKIKKFFTDLKTVAFTGSYSDLSNQPTIPSVSANPSTTTATLSGIEIDGTAYAVQSGSANVQSDWNQTDTTADDYIKNKPTIPAAQVNADWNASSGVAQILNKPTIQSYNFEGNRFVSGDYGMGDHDCNVINYNGMFYYSQNGPATSIGASTTDGALYSQRSDANWVVQIAQDYRNGNLFARSKNNGTWTNWHKLANSNGEIFNGRLIINANENTVGSYDEGLRINRAFNGYASLMIGGSSGSLSGTEDGEWWIGGNLSSLGRKLYIAHNGSTDCDTYFEVDSAADRHPKLHITNTGGVASGNYRAVNGNDVFSYLSITSTTGQFSNFKCSSNYHISFQKTGHIVRISTVIFNPDYDIAPNEGLAPVPDGYRPTDSFVYFVSTNNIVFTIENNVLKTANISATIPKGWYYPLNMFFMV